MIDKELITKTSIALNEFTNSLGIQNPELKQIFLEELFNIILTNPKALNTFMIDKQKDNLHS